MKYENHSNLAPCRICKRGKKGLQVLYYSIFLIICPPPVVSVKVVNKRAFFFPITLQRKEKETIFSPEVSPSSVIFDVKFFAS
jgi:hypothetical protein